MQLHLTISIITYIAPYFQFFPFIKDIGATGILIEWEDTFPYTKDLIQIGGLSNSALTCGAPYSLGEARQLVDMALDYGLTVIPLVQTIGHMEFVLKHDQWKGLREVESYPSSMCPSNSATMPLVRDMVKQILAFHEGIQYIHIGADEVCFFGLWSLILRFIFSVKNYCSYRIFLLICSKVWHLGLCPACTKRTFSSKYGRPSLYLDHVTEVAQYIKENYPNLRIIIWDDMIRNIDVQILKGTNVFN